MIGSRTGRRERVKATAVFVLIGAEPRTDRYGSVKRVAGAAGEGAVAVGSVHQYLIEQGAGAGVG
jgi:hypothetical protein